MNIKKILNKSKLKFLVFRTDRIGDVILSLQVAELLKKKFPESLITFVVRKYTKPLFNSNPFIDQVWAIDEFSESEFLKFIRLKKFDISIALYSTKLTAKLPFLANIPLRIGPMSKIYGLLYNMKIWQKRSRSLKNEAEYNNDLLKPLGIKEIAYPKLYLTKTEIAFGEKYFSGKHPIILHPGSGGSSKDWPLENYFKLGKKLKEKGLEIFFTGSKNELITYSKIPEFMEEFDVSEIMKKGLDIRQFLAVISQAKLFISNSTGPLHCASALKVKTVSFYPNLKACKPLRWGPFAEDKDQNFIFTPDIHDCDRCQEDCDNSGCMEKIIVEAAFARVLLMLES
ncbi:MAG: glycosyltransferase family 9 protein [bacterium]|nr:glycosyltransferase family 9 protein [bacterium]